MGKFGREPGVVSDDRDMCTAFGVSTSTDIPGQLFPLDSLLMFFEAVERAGYTSDSNPDDRKRLFVDVIGSLPKMRVARAGTSVSAEISQEMIDTRTAMYIVFLESVKECFLGDPADIHINPLECIEGRNVYKIIKDEVRKRMTNSGAEILSLIPKNLLRKMDIDPLNEYLMTEVALLIFNACWKSEDEPPREFVSHSNEKGYVLVAADVIRIILCDHVNTGLRKIASTNDVVRDLANITFTEKERTAFVGVSEPTVVDAQALGVFQFDRLIKKLAVLVFDVDPTMVDEYELTAEDYARDDEKFELLRRVADMIKAKIPDDILKTFTGLHFSFDDVGLGGAIKTGEKPHYDLTFGADSRDLLGNNIFLGRDEYPNLLGKFWMLLKPVDDLVDDMLEYLIQREFTKFRGMGGQKKQAYRESFAGEKGSARHKIFVAASSICEAGYTRFVDCLDTMLKSYLDDPAYQSIAKERLKSYRRNARTYLKKIVRRVLESRARITGVLDGNVNIADGSYIYSRDLCVARNTDSLKYNPDLSPQRRTLCLESELGHTFYILDHGSDEEIAIAVKLILKMLCANVLEPFKRVFIENRRKSASTKQR